MHQRSMKIFKNFLYQCVPTEKGWDLFCNVVMLVFELQEIFIWRASDCLDRVEMDSFSGWQGIFLGLPHSDI